MTIHLGARAALLFGLFLPLLPACSGGGGEIALTAEAKPYENALKISNAALELFRSGDAKAVYEKYLDPRLQQKTTAEQFAAPIQVTIQKFGPIRQYKPGQWLFTKGQNALMKLIFSTKIVQHERGTLLYQFQFEDDGKYAKIVGITVEEEKKGAKPAPQPAPQPAPEPPK